MLDLVPAFTAVMSTDLEVTSGKSSQELEPTGMCVSSSVLKVWPLLLTIVPAGMVNGSPAVQLIMVISPLAFLPSFFSPVVATCCVWVFLTSWETAGKRDFSRSNFTLSPVLRARSTVLLTAVLLVFIVIFALGHTTMAA